MHVYVTSQSTQAGIWPHTVHREDLPEVALSVGDRFWSKAQNDVLTVHTINVQIGSVTVHTVSSRTGKTDRWYADDALNMIERGDWEREVITSRISFGETLRAS